MSYQPKTGARCACRPGVQRDNCPTCEGAGWVIDFAAIRRQAAREGWADGNGSKCEACGRVIRPFEARESLDAERTRFEHAPACPPVRY